MKRGKQTERMLQKKRPEGILHKKLARKVLALILAAVTMVASMGTSIGMMEPVKVQAEATQEEATPEMFDIQDSAGNVLDTSLPIIVGSDALGSGVELKVALKDDYKNQNYKIGTITTLYAAKEADGTGYGTAAVDTPKAAGTYKISITAVAVDSATDGDVNLNVITNENPLEIGEVKIYEELPDADSVIKYAVDGETAALQAKSAYKESVTISADDYKVSDTDGDGAFTGDTAVFSYPGKDGNAEKIFYFQSESAVYAKKISLNFDTVAPVIDKAATTASAIGTDTATVKVELDSTKQETGTITYTLTNITDGATSSDPYAVGNNTEGQKPITDNKTGTFILSGLTSAKSYTFTVTAKDEAGNTDSMDITFTTEKAAYGENDVQLPASPYDETNHKVKFTAPKENMQASEFEFTVDGSTWLSSSKDGEKLEVAGTDITVTLNPKKSYEADKVGVRVAETDTTKASTGVKYGTLIKATLILTGATTLSKTTGVKYGDTLTATAAVDSDQAKVPLTYTFCTVDDEGTETQLASSTSDAYKIEDASCINKKIKVKVTASGYNDPAEEYATAITTDKIAKADGKAISQTITGALSDNEAHDKFVVTLTKVDGAQYSKDGENWVSDGNAEDDNIFEVDPAENVGKTLTFYVRMKGTETAKEGASSTCTVAIEKINQSTPNLNYSITKAEDGGDARTITITPPEGVNGVVEYTFDGTTWKDGEGANVSQNLTKDSTGVVVGIRMKEFATRNVSTAKTEPVDLSLDQAEKPSDFTVTATKKDDCSAWVVALSSADAGSENYEYSFDGTEYSKTASKEYPAAYEAQTITVYVRNAATGKTHSQAVSKTQELSALLVKKPVISGTTSFSDNTTVTITSGGTESTAIYYTTDGTAPTKSSTPYSSPFTLNASATIRAVEVKDGMMSSEAESVVFTKTGSNPGTGGNPGSSSGNEGTDSGSSSSTGGSSSSSSSGSGSSSSSSGGGSSSASTPAKPSTPTTVTNPDGSTTTTKTETKSDGTKVTTETTTAADGSKKETVTETKKDGTTTETTTETKTDGTKAESVVETNADGSKTESSTETKPDGSKTESVTEKAADGSVVKSTETVTASDGSAVKTETENTQNAKGNDIEVTTTTKTDTAGTVTSITEKTEIPESSSTTSTTVMVEKDSKGEVTSAEAEVENTILSGSKATISAAVVSQITEAAGTDSVAITMTVKDAQGSNKYEVKVDSKDMESGNKLYIYKLDTKTGKHIMVNAKTYTVSDSGNVSVSMKKEAVYELVDAKTATKINKEIRASIAPKKASQDLKPGKKTSFKLSSKADKENIKSITYLTSNKNVAAVSKNGRITAKKGGTVTVKAKVTLLNGSTKTIKMKVKVKKARS